jgi:hypothetical protein
MYNKPMFNKESKMSKGLCIVQGSKVVVYVGRTLREVMGIAQAQNRYAPLERAKVAYCTFCYDFGSVSNVKVGKFI